MPQTLPLDRKAIQLYARPSRDDHVWMVCGYATDMDGAPETMHIIAGYDVSQMHTIKAGIPLTFPAQPPTNIGDIVTTQNFRGAQTGKQLLIMQIVPREVWGQPGLTMFAGILQDPDGKLDGAWTANEGIMLSGQITDVGMTLHQINADLSCTPGHSLPQVLTKPIWTLGADEPWAATWGVREDIAALAEEGREIRRRIFTDTAEPDDEKRLTEISQLTHGAVHKIGYDTTFDRFENGLLRLGERDEGQYAGITTSADLARLEALADQAIRVNFEM